LLFQQLVERQNKGLPGKRQESEPSPERDYSERGLTILADLQEKTVQAA
jgi:hypothetical protein